MRAKPPGCFFVGTIERAAVHPGGHAVELLPHLQVSGDDVNDDDDDGENDKAREPTLNLLEPYSFKLLLNSQTAFDPRVITKCKILVALSYI